MAKKHFAKLPLVLQQVSSQITQLSVVTMQVQLCEWRQFMDHLAKTGAAVLSNGLMAPEDQDHEEEGAPAGSAEKYRRVMGKRQQTTVPQTDARIIRIRSTGQPCKSPPRAALSDSEDDRPLLALGEASRIAAKAKHETPLPALGMHEAAYIQQERQSLRQETIRKDQAVKLLKTAQKEVESANAMHQLLMAQVREAMCRRSACQEALNKAELEVTEHCEAYSTVAVGFRLLEGDPYTAGRQLCIDRRAGSSPRCKKGGWGHASLGRTSLSGFICTAGQNGRFVHCSPGGM